MSRVLPSPARARPSIGALSAALLALGLGTSLAGVAEASDAGSLRLDVGDIACPARAAVGAELERLLQGTAVQGALLLELRDAGADGVRARLTTTSGTLDRTLPLRADDCAELARTVAVVVREWLAPDWRALAFPATAPAPPAPPPEARRPALLIPSDAQVGSLRPDPDPRLRLLVVGGVARERVAPRVDAAVALGVESARPRAVGLALWLGYERAGTVESAQGSVSASFAWIGAMLRGTARLTRDTDLDLLAGPSLHVAYARSRGFAADESLLLPDPSFTAQARVRRRLGARLFATLGLAASVRAHRERLHVVNVGPVLVLDQARLSALLGIGGEVD